MPRHRLRNSVRIYMDVSTVTVSVDSELRWCPRTIVQKMLKTKPVALEYRRCAVIRERKYNHISLSQAGPPPANGFFL